LFDQGTPAPLRKFIQHEVCTAYELGWATLKNGELLAAAEADFDALVTTDQHLQYEQNLANRRLAILVLPTTSWPVLKSHTSLISDAIDALTPGSHVRLMVPRQD
jgi:hypothetical protein